MENNFDKYFKEKLEERKFEMKPEYWEGAEALIEADERGGKRRGYMVLMMGLLFLVGAGLYFGFGNNANRTLVNDADSRKIEIKSKTQSKAQTQIQSQADVNESKLQLDLDSNSSSKTHNLNPTETNDNEVESENQKINQNQKLNQNLSQTQTDREEVNPKKQSQSQNNTNHLKSNHTNSNKSISSDYIPKPNSSQSGNTNSNVTENRNVGAPDLIIPPTVNTNNEEHPKANFNTSIPVTNSDENISPTKKEDKESEKESEKVKELETNPTAIFSKPIAQSAIFIPSLEFLLSSKEEEDKDLLSKIKYNSKLKYPHHPINGFSYGITAGVVGYPLDLDSSQPFIGFKAGGWAEYNFGKNWSVGSELLYHYRSGNFVATKQQQEVKYSFGKSTALAELTPKNLHYVELPVFVKYYLKNINFEAGASLNYLAGVRGVVFENGKEIEKGLISKLGFKTYHANILLGAQYRMSDALRFGMRVNFTLDGILDKNAVLPNGKALRESKPLYLTFKVIQIF